MSQWEQIDRFGSHNPDVWKYIFTKSDAVAEAVLYRYKTFTDRTVICCSTQSGCMVGCRFCGSGDGFVRSLSPSEIVAQLTHVLLDHDVNPRTVERLQIMFMSMGEPLLNQVALIPAMVQLHGRFPHAALLISTSAPDVDYSQIRDVSRAISTVGLQFSVHESTDAARDKLIPFKKKLNLRQISEEGLLWHDATGRKPFFNYCAHRNNSGESDAERLYGLFPPSIWNATISVVCERDSDMTVSSYAQRSLAQNFELKLKARGYNTRTFDPAGQDDIGGGCGQLFQTQQWMRDNPSKVRPSAGKHLPVFHSPK